MPTVISHSETDQFLTCERKHYYAFGKPAADGEAGLQSKNVSDGLFKGNLGHAALEKYYDMLAVYQTKKPDDAYMQQAKDAALATITAALLEFPERQEIILAIYTIINAYCDYYKDEDQNDWRYVSVEQEFREEVNSEITFPFKPDLIRQHRRQNITQVVDHKFLSNLYNGDEIAIQPQLPKYVGTLRNLGYDITDGLYNLIGTRVLKTKPYEAATSMRRVPLKLTNKRIERSLLEQHRVVARIAELKQDEFWEHRVNRTANSWNCKNCPFLTLCIADLNGEDTTVMVKHNFEGNSYGYDKEPVDVY